MPLAFTQEDFLVGQAITWLGRDGNLDFGVRAETLTRRMRYGNVFSRAASPERSDLPSHYGVCMYVCMDVVL